MNYFPLTIFQYFDPFVAIYFCTTSHTPIYMQFGQSLCLTNCGYPPLQDIIGLTALGILLAMLDPVQLRLTRG